MKKHGGEKYPSNKLNTSTARKNNSFLLLLLLLSPVEGGRCVNIIDDQSTYHEIKSQL